MAIGIQPGTTAWDERSLKLDKQVKSASKVVFEKMQEKYPELEYLNKLPKNMILDAVGACQPDGGVWLIKGEL